MVQSVERALALLERLDAAGEPLPLADLARLAGLKPPTAHNLLQTLEALGYVRQEATTRRYALGPQALALGRRQAVLERLARAAAPLFAALWRGVDETVVLALYRDARRHTLLSAESAQPLRVAATEGVDDRLYTTATGRLLLSLLSDAELAAAVAALGPPGPDWPEADGDGLRPVLAAIRRDGLARYRNPRAHVVALAVPVALADPDAHVALGLYLPVSRHSAAREAELIRALREAAARIADAYERMAP